MDKTGYIILAVSVLIVLLITFVVSFLLYVKQKPPKGCENLGRDESKCGDCPEHSCRFYTFAHEEKKEK